MVSPADRKQEQREAFVVDLDAPVGGERSGGRVVRPAAIAAHRHGNRPPVRH